MVVFKNNQENREPLTVNREPKVMSTKKDENFIVFCELLHAYVEEYYLFPDKHNDYFRASVAQISVSSR